VGLSNGDFERWLKGALEVEHPSLQEICEGNLGGGYLVGDPEGYVERSLETGISLHKGTWRGARPLDFDIWMKGALGMERLSLTLKRLHREGLGGGELLHWGPWKLY